eukprot:7387402-Alexandrium_andersonii.AAC.1
MALHHGLGVTILRIALFRAVVRSRALARLRQLVRGERGRLLLFRVVLLGLRGAGESCLGGRGA